MRIAIAVLVIFAGFIVWRVDDTDSARGALACIGLWIMGTATGLLAAYELTIFPEDTE